MKYTINNSHSEHVALNERHIFNCIINTEKISYAESNSDQLS